jgi:hypothetical protein
VTADALYGLVGSRVSPPCWPDAAGTVLGISSVHPPFVRVRADSDGLVRRIAVHTLSTPSTTTTRRPDMAAAASRPAKKSPKKSKLAVALEGDDASLAAFLLAHQTYPDVAWKERAGRKSRKDGESRADFIRRVLGGEVSA